MRKTAFLLALLLALPLVLASTPSFNVADTFVDEVINGDNDLGDVVITTRPYLPENINFSTFSSVTAQQYDLLRWQGNETIRITQPDGDVILVKNSSFYANNLGVFNFYSLLNESKLGTMQVLARDDNVIELEGLSVPAGFELSFSEQAFILNDEKVITTNLNVNEDVQPGDYQISYLVNERIFNHSFEVLENLDWSIDDENLTLHPNISNGENKYIGYLLLENDGNDDVTISVSKEGNFSHLLIIPAPQTLFKKSTLRIEFSLQVPTSQKPTTTNISVNVSGGKNYEIKNFNIVVNDNIKPQIQSINFSTDKAYANNKLIVIATDNNKVVNVTLSYDNKTVFFEKDEQKFIKNIMFDKLSKYQFTFCAIDDDHNKICTFVNKTFVETKLISNYQPSIVMPTKKASQYSKSLLFNITQVTPEGVYVNLDEIVATTTTEFNDSYTIRLVDKDGGVKTFTKYIKELHITKSGPLYLEIRGIEVADYTGIISVTLPEYAEEVSDTKFSVSFKDYDIPEDFSKPWNYDSTLDCVVKDTGDLATTKRICTFEAPINIRPEDISVPTTISEREELEQKADVVTEQLQITKRRIAVIISLLVVIIIIGGLFSYFMIVHYPYVRISRGHDLKYEYNKKGEKEYDD